MSARVTSWVLVVHADTVFRERLSGKLVRAGFHVKAVSSSDAGLDFLDGDMHPTVVITDLQQGGARGISVIEHMRNAEVLRDVPVVVVAKNSEAGPSSYRPVLAEPYELGSIVNFVREAVQRSRLN